MWAEFQKFPALYQRVRVGNVEEMRARMPEEFERRLAKLVAMTREGKMYGGKLE